MLKVKKCTLQMLSLCLALAILMYNVPFLQVPAAAAEDPSPTLTVDSGTPQAVNVAMGVYTNGLYEAAVELTAGTHKYQAFSSEKTVTVPEKKTVYIRYSKKGLQDSINNADAFPKSATWVGSIDTIGAVDAGGNLLKNWKQDDPNAHMEYIGGGIFMQTFKLQSPLAKDTDLEYKVAFNDAWDGAIGADGSTAPGVGNVKVTVKAGTKEISIFADYTDHSGKCILTDSVSTPGFLVKQSSGGNVKESPFTAKIQLIGTVRGNNSDNWNEKLTEGWEFKPIGPQLYAYTQFFDSGSYEYKIVFENKYWIESTPFSSGNKEFTVNGKKAVTFLMDTSGATDDQGAAKLDVLDTVNNPDDLSKILSGSEPIPGPVPSGAVQNNNGTVSFSLPVTGSTVPAKASVKYGRDGAMDYAKTIDLDYNSKNKSFLSSQLWFGDDAVKIDYVFLVDGKTVIPDNVTTNDAGGTKYAVFDKQKFEGRNVYIPGEWYTVSSDNWNPGRDRMEYKGNGLYTFHMTNLSPKQYPYKVAIDKGWGENYGTNGESGGSNIVLNVPKGTTEIDLYYSDFSHLSKSSLNYSFKTIELCSDGDKVKMNDLGLNGVYTAALKLAKGTHGPYTISVGDPDKNTVDAFVLNNPKEVTFYYDTNTGLCYCDSSDTKIDSSKVCYNTQDTKCKSIYGAVKTGQNVNFGIQTGTDVDGVDMMINGPVSEKVSMDPGASSGGTKTWTVTKSWNKIGQYTYYFVLHFGSQIQLYNDDDGFYGKGRVSNFGEGKSYDLVIYSKDFKTPDWMKGAVIYQIFPDRFNDGNRSNDHAQVHARGSANYEFVEDMKGYDWYSYPENPDREKDPDYPTQAIKGNGTFGDEIYGGDLEGITQRIGYLKALGVNCIYINPVLNSISSHRYDTSDYSRIDPILGTEGDFSKLVQTAKQNGMKIILDGVYNHVADDSVYFDRYYRYVGKSDKVGAYPYWAYVYDQMNEKKLDQAQAEAAAKAYFGKLGVRDYTYTQWFNIQNQYFSWSVDSDGKVLSGDKMGDRQGKGVYKYDCWAGYNSMPEIKSTNDSEYQTPGWAGKIIEGPDSAASYWISRGSNGWRLDVADGVSDETWQHLRTSVKALNSDNVIIGELWGDSTKYLLGDMYDSVMNYVYRNAVLNFARGTDTSETATKNLEKMRERYPDEAFQAMMNLVGSHDTPRLISSLDGVAEDRNDGSDIKKAFPTAAGTSDKAKQLQYMVSLLQMTYPGAPTIYYGDELQMVGADDPDCRRAMAWGEGSRDTVEWYANLAAIRRQYNALQRGEIIPLDANDDDIISYARKDVGDQMVIAANRTESDKTVTLDVSSAVKDGEFTDLITGKKYTVSGGSVEITIPAYRGVILADHSKKADFDRSALKPAYDPSYKVNYSTLPTGDTGDNDGGDSGSKKSPSGTSSVNVPATISTLSGENIPLAAGSIRNFTVTCDEKPIISQGNGAIAIINLVKDWDPVTKQIVLQVCGVVGSQGGTTGIYATVNGRVTLLFTVKLGPCPVKSDTTSGVAKKVGDVYWARVAVPHNAKIVYSAGSSSVVTTMLKKLAGSGSSPDSYLLGFRAVKGGTTGLYITVDGVLFRLYVVSVK